METLIKEAESIQKQQTQRVSGSDALLLSLIEEKVSTIFGYPGGAIMPIYDKLMDYKKQLKHILTRHEQGAVHAAQGFARVSGKTGVCFATSGPGATNLITGIADAFMDSTPIVCITGQVGSHLIGSDAFQETDVVGISMPVTKWNYQVTRADEIPEAIAKAFYIAKSGRPGPVLIDITKDAMLQDFDFAYKPCDYIRSYIPRPLIKEEQLNRAAQLINEAKKPFALIGQGVILGGAEKELLAFLEKTGMPFACTLLGLGAIPNNHPQHMGMLGMHGHAAPNIKTNDCDLLIGIGMRFDDRVTGKVSKYARQAKIIHFELDKAEINKIIKVDAYVNGNVKESLPAVTAKVIKNKHQSWIDEFKLIRRDEEKRVIQKEINPEGNKISMGEVLRIINTIVHGDAIFVTDVGQHQMIASRYFDFKNTRSWVTSGGLGTMGFGLPAAMGAQFGAPDKTVIMVAGDGGFQMTLQELGTIAYNRLPVKMIVLNNNYLGMVRQWQELFFDERYSATPISSPDFPKLASSYGIAGEMVKERTGLQAAIQRMLDFDGPYLLEVKVVNKGNVFPMIPQGAAVNEVLFGDEQAIK
ncbi:MAG: acetolactate synthase, large subunit, biosynthetic type [Bacteroidetes bacterium HGW-Bacteroidetes-4]|jgi:acetolactate synthase-1/2/3 large subunit|nr:MAG: acetolactate synthase, large subunit, biosynthetic type [Bacteroidetes bacterium HGW-Bacteroidetes-4]